MQLLSCTLNCGRTQPAGCLDQIDRDWTTVQCEMTLMSVRSQLLVHIGSLRIGAN